ncbi:MAG: tRNA pseudouridine synthase A [Candidatus Baldrarchaeia archaeon]
MSKKIALLVSYLGCGYFGFQLQKEKMTVERVLLNVLSEAKLLNENQRLEFASRTDTGVHALCQVVSFLPRKSFEPSDIDNLNSLLPDNIKIWGYSYVDKSFNPRYDALYRHYVFLKPYEGENVLLMNAFAKFFLGQHDFRKFIIRPVPKNTFRRVYQITCNVWRDFLRIDVVGRSFARGMIKSIVSALLISSINKNFIYKFRYLASPISRTIFPIPKKKYGTGLILFDVCYPSDVSFIKIENIRNYMFRKIVEYISGYIEGC